MRLATQNSCGIVNQKLHLAFLKAVWRLAICCNALPLVHPSSIIIDVRAVLGLNPNKLTATLTQVRAWRITPLVHFVPPAT